MNRSGSTFVIIPGSYEARLDAELDQTEPEVERRLRQRPSGRRSEER